MASDERPGNWLSDATTGFVSSIQKFSNQLGVLAARIDEIGAEVLGDVELEEEGDLPPPAAPQTQPYEIIHANGDISEVVGFNSLPVEIIHLIILKMNSDATSLATISRVSRTLFALSRDIQVWNELYERGSRQWTFMQGPIITAPPEDEVEEPVATPSSARRPAWFTPKSLVFNDFTAALFNKLAQYRDQRLPKQSAKGSLLNEDGSINFDASRKWWIAKYAAQSKSNKPVPNVVTLPPHSPSILSRIRQPVVYALPVFGPGVGAAQKAIYDFVANAPHVVSMYTGVRGIGSGIGISLHGTTMKLSPIHDPPQPFHQIAVADENWKQLFANASVLVYAVSHKVPLTDSKDDLHSFLSLEFEAPSPVPKAPKPLLILSFIEDLTAADIADALGLSALPTNRVWAVKCFDPLYKMRDLHFALQWAKHLFQE